MPTSLELEDLKPHRKHLVFDLAQAAGLNMQDWIDSSNDPRGFKANPKYCYEWAYVEPGKLIILNLWHPNMTEEDGRIVQRANFRADAEFHRDKSGKRKWEERARCLDTALQTALKSNLPVRVIILDGQMREKGNVDSAPSSVRFRELDPEPWTITDYDWATGAFEVARGILEARYVDQFDIARADKNSPDRRERTGSEFVRDPAVRRRVLARAGGRCELCGEPGFKMASGSLYLETHHVVPLSEGGADDDSNVVALCANDHRRAHFAAVKTDLIARLIACASSPSRTDLVPTKPASRETPSTNQP